MEDTWWCVTTTCMRLFSKTLNDIKTLFAICHMWKYFAVFGRKILLKFKKVVRALACSQKIMWWKLSYFHNLVTPYFTTWDAFDTGGKVCITIDDTSKAVQLPGKRGQRTFAFDRIFNEKAKQEEVYNVVAKDLVESCIKGYNCSCFAVSAVLASARSCSI